MNALHTLEPTWPIHEGNIPNVVRRFHSLNQAQIDWLRSHGVPVEHMAMLPAIRRATGIRASDGRFEIDTSGEDWIVFEEPRDLIFWNPRTRAFATWTGMAFAIGEGAIANPATYSFDCNLNVFADPIEWLKHGRDGTVIIRWSGCFDKLRDAPRVAVDETILHTFKRAMKPAHMPEVLVRSSNRSAAA